MRFVRRRLDRSGGLSPGVAESAPLDRLSAKVGTIPCVNDDRDWTWLARGTALNATPAPVDQPVWTIEKGERHARMLLRPHPLGMEARCMIGGELYHAVTFRTHEADKLRQHCTGVLQDFQRLGWTLAGVVPSA